MKVAICRTKFGEAADALYDAFVSGLGVYGDTYLPIYEGSLRRNIIGGLRECDLSMQVCESTPPPQDVAWKIHHLPFRLQIREFQNKIKKRRIILETGFVKNNVCKHLPLRQRYFQVGYDGMKAMAKCYNADSPDDRWTALGVQAKPWRKGGSHILIMGQNIHGASARLTDVLKWWEDTMVEIRKLTDRPIKMRPHPTQADFPSFDIPYEITKNEDIRTDLEDCWCVVARSTSGAVDAIINGVPVITPDEICMAYDVASHSIENINDPATPDRTQWLNDLAYSQWSIEEIEAGVPWGRLRGFSKIL